MIQVYFLLIFIVFFLWLKELFRKNTAEQTRYIKRSAFILVALVIALLTITGRLPWLLAVLGGLFAMLSRFSIVLRFVPVIFRYGPRLQKIIQFFYQSKRSNQKPSQAIKKSTRLTKQSACDILGVSIMATRQEIINAHRKLILKNHPDRGGTIFLAAKINQAKDFLLHKYNDRFDA
jgi:hypothetical protein